MPDISSSVPTELPSTRSLIRSTILAAGIAGVLLATVVLPAEYGIDPTGIGNVLGLTQMGKIKASLAAEAELPAADAAESQPASSRSAAAIEPAPVAAAVKAVAIPETRTDTMSLVLQPNQGREIKLSMRQGERVTFSWSTAGGVVNYDLHADSKEPPRPYHGYKKGSRLAADEGELVAAFDGWHGWFWRNRDAQPVTVTLRASGQYQEIKEAK